MEPSGRFGEGTPRRTWRRWTPRSTTSTRRWPATGSRETATPTPADLRDRRGVSVAELEVRIMGSRALGEQRDRVDAREYGLGFWHGGEPDEMRAVSEVRG